VPPSPTPAPTGLPVEEVVAELGAALAAGSNAVLVAEPGAGKTTVVPLRLVDEAWLTGRAIVVLQPRRVVARAAARRMAVLLGEEVGATVGYRTGEDRRVGPHTRIEVVTEGILTRRVQGDPELSGVGLIIFDEFHERHLQSDLGLALCLDVQRALRPDLRLLVMSATLDAEGVAGALGGPDGRPAPVVVSRGRLFPVDIQWRPPAPTTPVLDTVARTVHRALADTADTAAGGDVLVFLPGTGEIGRVHTALRAADGGVDIRVLHGTQRAAEQDWAMAPAPPGRRKVMLSTDLAETSLTVEGVSVVVDAGLSRRPRFDPATGLTRLHTGPASAASATQRAGRAGRTGPGVAYRLWAQGEHRARRAWPDPEITTADLTGLVLELAVWGAAAGSLTWLDPPPRAALAQGRALLTVLGALDPMGAPDPVGALDGVLAGDPVGALPTVTPLGRAMVGVGAHPRLAAIVAGAGDADRWLACLTAALVEEPGAGGGRRSATTADLAEALRPYIAGPPDSGESGRSGGRRRSGPAGEDAEETAARVRRRARRLAKRVGAHPAPIDPNRAGAVVARGYPDRLAQSRGDGRLRLRGGTGLRLAEGDGLSNEAFLVVVDTGGPSGWGPPGVGVRADRTVRLAAAIDQSDVEQIGGAHVVTDTEVFWDDERDDLRARRTRRLDALVLASTITAAPAGEGTVAALVEVIARRGLSELPWSAAARSLQQRAAFARHHDTASQPATAWPDCSDTALLDNLEGWLAPRLKGATGRGGLARVDLREVIRHRLGALVHRLEDLVPTTVTVASGKRVALDYTDGAPRLRARAQDLYGTTRHPRILGGRVPVVIEVLSPAGRPLQVTADLPSFWSGSWSGVRREMAGRYPKHDWPVDPAAGRRRPGK